MKPDRAHSLSFVIVAPVGRDGELICSLLSCSGYAAVHLKTIHEVELIESPFLLGLILTDEALANDGLASLRRIVSVQPIWSDLPVMLLTSGSSESRYAATASQVRMEIRSLFLLDRPVRKELLLSAVQVAYTSRLKQLEIRDATERQSRTDEALRNTERLAAGGQLAATMAHEVNNPLEAIGNLLYLVENSVSIEDAQTFSKLASQELSRISEIISQTLRYHRAPAIPALTELSEIIASALALFKGKLRERRINLAIKAPKTIAFCSAGEIRQALVNLIGNALDAMPGGGTLHLRVSSTSIGGNGCARVTVADTGSGIHDEIRPSLFTQFFTTKGSRGTGLGLWLTRDIVRRNHGKLRFRSRTISPSGTVFSILLPSSEIGQSGHAAPESPGREIEAA
ncbi:MAG: HAMP domain-containing sensor histidine kinase [Terracidiphilus sp.]